MLVNIITIVSFPFLCSPPLRQYHLRGVYHWLPKKQWVTIVSVIFPNMHLPHPVNELARDN